ncbi:biotin/acetyl-CoA-carboxylase ligase [Gloeomargarita lithophora Alchichica-D10]|uniref:biotin--[biotin carboxyl-carrier protein] ligase n=1 Tax=Gloeomargarita lithophora Alchichica-D10 TaxID=1188229 RepID=A0A1J0ADF1_9CYAN|nr:biotin--[acetyl-CoA-carboxylase] ligase [Gloeomargarita lithophora]APB33974.1 biotin/acetyl-CoA-carboxylase ligase [Gloeomargarita lithophora Alchichica-D10]
MSFPPWLTWLDECASTNTWALQHIDKFKQGDVVFTPRQTSGRGQQGRLWYAPAGVLTASFILQPIAPAELPLLSLAAGLAVIHALEDLISLPASALGIKWPNDVLLWGRKLAGVLGEARLPLAVVGVGLNRQVDWEMVLAAGTINLTPEQVTSLSEITATPPDVLPLLVKLRDYLLQAHGVIRHGGLAGLLPQLRQRDVLYGCPLIVSTGQGNLTGAGAGIDELGRLLVQSNNGSLQALAAGRVLRWEALRRGQE